MPSRIALTPFPFPFSNAPAVHVERIENQSANNSSPEVPRQVSIHLSIIIVYSSYSYGEPWLLDVSASVITVEQVVGACHRLSVASNITKFFFAYHRQIVDSHFTIDASMKFSFVEPIDFFSLDTETSIASYSNCLIEDRLTVCN